MTFDEALIQIKDNSHLIGSKVEMGTIDELVIYPNNEESKAAFKDIYFKTLSAEEAIAPFVNEDVSVSAILNKKRIRLGFFMASTLEEIKEQLEK
ncbi:hypothetical protein [Phenylobacterium aquaticum]|uniref:hypothetical protein n=1 Tax=Phenylobacterium aquaticum TaxID=1763816 RepID=UPI0026EA57E0|nr:hypothetical protein [Phenylobacterium aquaticum]